LKLWTKTQDRRRPTTAQQQLVTIAPGQLARH